MNLRLSCFLSLCLLAAACGDDGTTSDGGTGTDTGGTDTGGTDTAGTDTGGTDTAGTDTAGTDTATDTGGTDSGSDTAGVDAGTDAGVDLCATDDDCVDGRCFLDPDGHRECVSSDGEPPRTTCLSRGIGCCADDDACTDSPGGVCIDFSHRYCGGPAPPMTNVCHYDECTADADCSDGDNGACLVRGVGSFFNRCAYGPCRVSGDCRAGGTCKIFDSSCGYSASLFCAYPDDVCSDTLPCEGPTPMLCIPNADGHGSRCVRNDPRP